MANVNCPLIGQWSGSNSLNFSTNGTIDVGAQTNALSFLVWERVADHKLITLDDNGVVIIYDFTYTGGASASLVITGSGALAGTYASTNNAPAPLDVSQLPGPAFFIDSWIAQDPNTPSWKWNLQYVAEGLVTTTHLSMHHTFVNAFIIRGDAANGYHYIYGQMRYANGVLAKYMGASSSKQATVEEIDGGTYTTVYTQTA
jgi:hypothetical protein